ncbi:hypothetical protein EC973_007733 [Apophysomyces ossiformis]|uniref:Uncharacterized protein n=1 Tax=Apophysomyces ossiformis TaxID=679940 RepID=A0A8H7BVE2_9FUNG|nr:hypothetical protein EC973_007733 [Apophysomyces ossiformis]
MPIQPPSSHTARDLLGLPPAAEEIHTYLRSLHPSIPEPDIKSFTDCTYYAYKSLGISFCFVPDGNRLRLDGIDLYNAQTRDGFQPFCGEYPCGLTSTMVAHEIVAMLGEPDRKGGGGKTRVPCWIEYQFKDKGGLLIQLHGADWDDREMGWTSLVLF